MKCLRITLQRMASRTSIQSKLRPPPGRSPRPRRSKCRQIMRRHAIRFTCIRSGRATFSQPCSPAPTRRSSRARFAAVHESGSGPGCVKTRGRSIAIEQLSRSRPFDVPALRAHSISWPNTKISFSSRFGILSFHTAWARCRRWALPSLSPSGKRFGKSSTDGFAALYRHACRPASPAPASAAIGAGTQLPDSPRLLRVSQIMEGPGEYGRRLSALRRLPS